MQVDVQPLVAGDPHQIGVAGTVEPRAAGRSAALYLAGVGAEAAAQDDAQLLLVVESGRQGEL